MKVHGPMYEGGGKFSDQHKTVLTIQNGKKSRSHRAFGFRKAGMGRNIAKRAADRGRQH
jgi:hypothetical protein